MGVVRQGIDAQISQLEPRDMPVLRRLRGEDNPFARPVGKLEVGLLSVNDFSIFAG